MPEPVTASLEWRHESGFVVSTDKARLQRDRIHAVLTVSTWSPGIDPATVNRAIDHSLCFGLYRDGVQVGFGRFITDYATFAYMADVYVDPSLRGQGLGRFLVSCMLQYPVMERYRRLLLATTTAAW
ncbi:MAG: GNAT family N-acetyltransferase, partial [Acidobacteriaceae bacterium]|nr:GNAT family N-acetyltransferase [Acidobacteriaceae bacterium]